VGASSNSDLGGLREKKGPGRSAIRGRKVSVGPKKGNITEISNISPTGPARPGSKRNAKKES